MRSFSTFQVIFKYGVLLRSILISFPNPEAELLASALIKFPFSLVPKEYKVFESAPLTFLTSKVLSSSSVNSNTFISSADKGQSIRKKSEINKIKNFFS